MFKLLSAIVLGLTLASAAQAQNIMRRGYYVTGTDAVSGEKIKTTVSVELNSGNDSARVYINRKPMEGTHADGVVAAYDTTPTKYFYYEINLKPRRDREGRVILKTSAEMNRNNSSLANYGDMVCGTTEANAMLTAYKGNQTSTTECLILE